MIQSNQMDHTIVEKFSKLFPDYESFSIEEQSVIITPDSEIDEMYVLEDGLIRQYIYTPSGSEITVHIFRPFSFVPLLQLIGDIPNKYYFEACTDITVKSLPYDQIKDVIYSEPEIVQVMAQRFARAIDGMVSRIEHLAFENSKDRIHALLQYLGEKIGHDQGDHTVIDLKLTHEDIASWIGVARETVSRNLSELKSEGVIANTDDHQIVILRNPD